MPSALYWELEKRVGDEIDRTVRSVGNGGCLGGTVDEVVGLYRERHGYLQGLRAAMSIAKRIETGEE